MRQITPMTDRLASLHQLAHEVINASKVPVGGQIPGAGTNVTGFTFRVPGGTQTYYPAFWMRDAAMMLGSDLVPTEEVKGWVTIIAKTQPGPSGLQYPHGLIIPPFSIPDHITLKGEACWFPGAYAEQGRGDFGYLPPADDAFYFIQMVDEVVRLEKSPRWLDHQLDTGWGRRSVRRVAEEAFASVEVDPTSGLVICSDRPGQTRVDWGFCDSITKSGSCLMPSLLRWQAAKRLAHLCEISHEANAAANYTSVADLIASNLTKSFYRAMTNDSGILLSATEGGRKDDVWASAFAVWLHLLPKSIEHRIAAGLLSLYQTGGVVSEGQIRHLPTAGPNGGYWDLSKSNRDTYQNGGYWATPAGWFISALSTVDHTAARAVFDDYWNHIEARRADGAPFEWTNPSKGMFANANYGSSVGLVSISLEQFGWH